ncbi:MAG TPA: peptide chain release factor N(5)-glutamine methyltransferase [Candidatus Binatus sp.]|nr:peptide chain release factor N(5)-glutamine methyltransferase [Candidatus Binatus sp.]
MAITTVADALRAAVARLEAAGVEEARVDAEVLLARALGTTRTGVVLAAYRPLPDATLVDLQTLVARRAAREPLQHIVGEREFWSLPFTVDRRVLVPRPETELLVDTVLRVAPGARRILEVGTGSGVVAAALARERPGTRVWASDIDARALAVARVNLARHAPDAVALVRGDLLAPFRAAAFDVVVSNPPYLADGELATLAPEVRDHEPRVALAAGPDGLAALRGLVADAPRVLAPGGWLVVEMGAGQAAAVRTAAEATGRYATIEVHRDGAGFERVLAAREGRGSGWIPS